jgi:very-short-patch-repair endonuclease
MRDGAVPDKVVSRVAERQLELVTTQQLNAAGLRRETIAGRCRKGLLHRVHRGVYLVGPLVWLPGARDYAAVLALGDAAVVSHQSAAALWGLTPRLSDVVDITVVNSARHRPGIRVHRVPDLPADERTYRNGIPITTPARTILDFASQAARGQLEQAIAEAYVQRLTTEKQLRAILDRHPRRPGAAGLRAELYREGGPAWSRSEAEHRMKELLRQAKLPPGEMNQIIAGHQADFVWRDQRLIVEVDGYQFHGHRSAFERDRKRDAAHTLAGYRVIRITWRQLTEEPVWVAVTIARALGL